MRRKRMTGRTIAAALGVREPTVSEWRAGLYRPDADRLALLAHVLDVPVADLLGDDSATESSAVPTEPRPNLSADVLGLSAVGDPVGELVRQGQAEQAAWLLEFAARLLEAGAQRLRQGVQRDQIIRAVESTEAAVRHQAGALSDAATPPTASHPLASAAPPGRHK